MTQKLIIILRVDRVEKMKRKMMEEEDKVKEFSVHSNDNQDYKD